MRLLNSQPYKAVWAYALAVLALVVMAWLGQPQAQEPAAPARSEPVREAVQQLLADDRLLHEEWSTRAAQWPGAGPVADGTRQTLQKSWPELLADIEALRRLAANVLRAEQIQKVREQLRPYLTNANAETRKLATQLDEKLQPLLAEPGAATVPISWARLERIAADMDQMQETIRDFRRMSLAKEIPDSAKLPMRVFVQLSMTFPTAGVRDFVTVANRVVQRRWALRYQLEKDRVAAPKAEPVVEPQPRGWGVLYLSVAGALGMVLLWRAQQKAQAWQQRCEQDSQTVKALQAELSVARQAAQPPAPLRNDDALWRAQLAEDVPDLRGRIKNVQLRFDAGLALDMAAQDLTFIDAKLGEWDQRLTRAQDDTAGVNHG